MLLSAFIALALIFSFTGCPNPSESGTLTATLKYHANGGTGTVPAAQIVDKGTILTIAEKGNLASTGKTFAGWNTTFNGKNGTAYAPGDSLKMDADWVLYAQWADTIYTVTYDANGGTGTVPTQHTVNEGIIITVKSPSSLNYTGKFFDGWNTKADGSGTSYVANNSLTVNENITLYAQWVDRYTVTYHANGGTGTAPSAQTVNEGSTITISGRGSLSYTGKNFNGWNTETDGSGTSYAANNSLTVNENINLYAQWTPIQYTVTYNANNGTGTVPEPQTADVNSSITLADADALTRDNYSFNGWNTVFNGSGTPYAAGDSFTVEGNITLYAQWIPTQYTVTYHVNSGTGTVPGPQTVECGGSITIEGATLTRDNYFFGGWNTYMSGAGTTHKAGSSFTPNGDNPNITLYALWVAPRIDQYFKEVTDDGNVQIRFQTGDQYIHEGTTVYYLYRCSTSQYGTYLPVAFVIAEQFMGVIEDTTADWTTTGSYYYRVVAESGGVKVWSTNCVRINKVSPKVSMQYSTLYLYGYCGVGLLYDDDTSLAWGATTSSTTRIYDLLVTETKAPPPPGNCILYTGTSEGIGTWVNRGPLTIRRGHTYMITVFPTGSVESSFDKSNWTFLTM
jgi:uncharacterized repeat protein (TIGR02543 family)